MSLVVTVLVSASVSGLVTLSIEYLAKPRLEARKEELLELHRRRRELKSMVLKITTLSAMWAPHADDHSSELSSELDRALDQVEQITRQLWDNIEWYAGTFASLRVFGLPSVQNLILQYILGARAIYLSERPSRDKLQILREMSEPLQIAFGTHWPITRGKAITNLSKALDKYVPSGIARRDNPVWRLLQDSDAEHRSEDAP